MPSKILNFSKDRLITGINIIDGMLFFTDNKTEPKKINIEKFKGNDPDVVVNHSSGTTKIYGRTFEERDITVIKEHPISALSTSLSSEAGGNNDIIDSSDDGYDWNNDDNDAYGDDTLFLGDDNSDINNVIHVETQDLLARNLNNTIMLGEVHNASALREKGVYYTFDSDIGNSHNIDQIIAEVGNKSFKKQHPNVDESIRQYISVKISADSSDPDYDADGIGQQSHGDGIWWVAYAQEAGKPPVYGNILHNRLNDPSVTPTGTIDDFVVKVTHSTGFIETVTFEATYENIDSIGVLSKAFYISKGYLYAPSTPPTFEEVKNQINNFPENTEDNNFFPARLEPDSNMGQIAESLGSLQNDYFVATKFIRLEPGYTYYVYGFMQTLNQSDEIISSVASFASTSSGNTIPLPAVKHETATPFENHVELEANVTLTGDNGIIEEKGFFVSTTIFSAARLKAAFPGLAANADGSSQEVGVTDTFKIVSTTPLDAYNNTGLFEVSTSGKLNITGGTEVYYMAYAKNGSGGISYGSRTGFEKEGRVASIKTIDPTEEQDPVIILNDVSFNINLGVYEINFDYDISFMPDGVSVVDSGVVFALPSGAEINANKNGFQSVSQIDDARRSRTILQSDFTFAASGDNAFLGTYSIEDFEYDYYPSEDGDIWGDVRGVESYLLDYPFSNPIALALSSYAYVVGSDGKTTKTSVKIGATATSSGISFSNLNSSYAPDIQTRNNRGDVATNITNTSLTLEGRILDNSATFNTPFASNGLGFYYSTTDKPALPAETFVGRSEEWHDAMDEWIAKATTIQAAVTITSAITNHATGQGDEGWFEIDKNIPGLTGGSTVYFIAYAKPRPQSTNSPYAFWNTASLNRTKYGSLAEISLRPNYTSVQSGDEPLVSILDARVGATNSNGTSVTFKGSAAAQATYYDITKKGFYYKLKSIVGASATQAQIQTAMASATNRFQLSTTDFVQSSQQFAKTGQSIANGEYYVSAFCETSTAGTTETFISSNSIDFNIANVVVPQDTTPVLSSKSSADNFPRVLKGEIIRNNIEIAEKGFYIIGESGTTLARPANGTALKSIYDSPPSGVDIHKINSPVGNSVFQQTFSSQKRNYTYYYAAYAKNNSGEEGISSNIVKIFNAANIRKFVEANQSLVNISGDGFPKFPGGVYRGGETLYIRVKTENGYDGNWRISSLGNWSGTITPIRANKVTNNGEVKLAISPQLSNGFLARSGRITITHGSDSSISTNISLMQEGASVDDVFEDEPDEFYPWPPTPRPDYGEDSFLDF